MKTIQLKTNDFQIFSYQFCGLIILTAVFEILVLTLLIFGGAK